MCFWLLDHGRCGEDFPTAHNQYMFIRDDVVTPASIKTEKDECNARRPSPKIMMLTNNETDFSSVLSDHSDISLFAMYDLN